MSRLGGMSRPGGMSRLGGMSPSATPALRATRPGIRYTGGPMQKESWSWTTQHLPERARMARWGHFGIPVLLFPSAGGDFEEIERFHLIAALGALIADGRIKIYSIDGVAVRAWLGNASPQYCARLQTLHDRFVHDEVVPRIRRDCQNEAIEPIVAGVSLGAFAAIAAICRYPQVFRAAVALSGAYDLARRLRGVSSEEIRAFAPASYLSRLEAPRLEQLRRRMIVLGSGEGAYETPAESRRLTAAFKAHGVHCRLSLWGAAHDHTWTSWREMLPQLLAEQL
ncbi:MAG: alpha/beta hydrolase-fold protein [Steroidobacteraceae bacterium]